MCTIATFDPYDDQTGGGDIGYASRKETPDGSWVNATGILLFSTNAVSYIRLEICFEEHNMRTYTYMYIGPDTPAPLPLSF